MLSTPDLELNLRHFIFHPSISLRRLSATAIPSAPPLVALTIAIPSKVAPPHAVVAMANVEVYPKTCRV